MVATPAVHGRRRIHPLRSCTARGAGGYSVVETVIIIPVTVMATLLVIQVGLQMLAHNAAQAAAQDGVRAARGYGSTADRGRLAAADYVDQVAPTLLHGVQIDSDRTSTTVTVRVRANVLRVMPPLIPGNVWRVDEEAAGPVERFIPPPDQ